MSITFAPSAAILKGKYIQGFALCVAHEWRNNMSYIIVFILGALAGFVVTFLVMEEMRNV